MLTADSEHDERIIDESLQETFPASDPISPARPGSLLGMRYAARSRKLAAAGSYRAMLPWLIGALLGGAIVGAVLARRRRIS